MTQIVSSGQIATGVNPGGAIVERGGLLEVSSGSAPDVTVLAGGEFDLSASGTASGVTVSSGGLLIAPQGEPISGLVLEPGALESLNVTVLSGQTSSGPTLTLGAVEVVSYGGRVTGGLVDGGAQDVYGVASGVVVEGWSGPNPFYPNIYGTGEQYLVFGGVSGASAFGTVLLSGGVQGGYGLEVDTTVYSGAEQYVGGVASGAVIHAGGMQLDQGAAYATTVLAGGFSEILPGIVGPAEGGEVGPEAGLASGITVSSGGMLLVFSTATVQDLTVLSGGVVALPTSAYLSGLTSALSPLDQEVFEGQTSTGFVVSSGGFQALALNATSIDTEVSGGVQVVEGVASGTVVQGAGGSWGQLDNFAGIDVGTIVSSGGEVILPLDFEYSGSFSWGATILASGFEVVAPYTNASGAVISSGGTMLVDSSGYAQDITVSSGGALFVEIGARAPGATVEAGGAEIFDQEVVSGSGATGAVIVPGQEQVVDSGGTASSTLLQAGLQAFGSVSGYPSRTDEQGALQQVGGVAPGSAFGTIVSGDAEQLIYANGLASGAVVSSGGVQVDSGGVAEGTELLSGGTLSVTSASTVSGLLVHAGSIIDLIDVASAVVAESSSGLLIVSSGGQVVETLSPVAPLGGLIYATAPDGNRGTEIVFQDESVNGLMGQVTSAESFGNTVLQAYGPLGALLGGEVIHGAGPQTITDLYTAAGAAVAHLIVQDAAGLVETQVFDANYNQVAASLVQTLPGGTVVAQSFDSAWDMTGAVITSTPSSGVVLTQDFDGSWSLTGATLVTAEANGEVVSQTVDGDWNQISATIVQTLPNGMALTQDYGSSWALLSAVGVLGLGGGQTLIQDFDSAWAITGAQVVTVSGGSTTDAAYSPDWALTGETVSTTISPGVELVQAYDASGNLLAGEDHLLVTAGSGPEVFAHAMGLTTTYLIHPGDLAGDIFAGFVTAAADRWAHDVLEFSGFGAGAALTELGPGQWMVAAPGRAGEVFTLSGVLSPAAGDVKFIS